jgi:hypothetical protein
MTTLSWHADGQYFETCSCDFVCPCIPGQMAVPPTKGSCTFARAFRIDRGCYGTVSLDGLTPEEMGKGNWSVGVIADARASAEQRDAVTSIASGTAGGPMAALSALVHRHPAADRFALAHAMKSHVDALGLRWSDTSGKNNGQYAPSSWGGA